MTTFGSLNANLPLMNYSYPTVSHEYWELLLKLSFMYTSVDFFKRLLPRVILPIWQNYGFTDKSTEALRQTKIQ